jgi:lipopolysaccharide export system permease protein|tara:strand:+ start:122 stop:1264 length:1143 start_codon:yes stop_codon:yes gene_type:complete
MLKNKIYKYLSTEIFKNFITILLTFTAIAWTVRAVNFLDLMIEDGYSAGVYFKYSILNISTIVTRFVPLSFLLSLVISIAKFERQQELMILWTMGQNKIKVANIFLLLGFFVALFQITLSLIINPFTLNKSRSLLRETEISQVSSVLRGNDFSDAIDGVTFHIGKKKPNNELSDIFIKDISGSLNIIVSEINDSANTTIIAKSGFVTGNKIILFNGIIQTLNKKNEIQNVDFQKTELNTSKFKNRTIKQPKIQETSSVSLFQCFANKDPDTVILNCPFYKKKGIVIETLARRIGLPLYIPLVSIIASFLLIYKKEKEYNYLKKYTVFGLAFIILIFAEIFLKYTGFSSVNLTLYLLSPLILFITLYSFLLKNMISGKLLK